MMNVTYGISEEKGFRSTMEDRCAVYVEEHDGFFAAEVYDGHGGVEAARMAATILTPRFLEAWRNELGKTPGERRRERELLRQAYLETDQAIIDAGIRGGTTAAHFYLIGDRMLIANAGDSRVIVGKKKGAAMLTFDHKPDVSEEKDRIESLGGVVLFHGIPRVQGELAMSRSLGDAHLKPYVTAEPRIVEIYAGRENDFAVVACDGVWDVLTPEKVMKIVRSSKDPQTAANKISQSALDAKSADNISVIVVDLRSYTESLARKEMELIALIDHGIR